MKEQRDIDIYNKFLDYLEKNIGFGKRIYISNISKAMLIPTDHLNDAYNKVSGNCPSKIIVEKKIEKAISYYTKGSLDENIIADKLGYSDLSSFCHFFKKHTGRILKSYKEKEI